MEMQKSQKLKSRYFVKSGEQSIYLYNQSSCNAPRSWNRITSVNSTPSSLFTEMNYIALDSQPRGHNILRARKILSE